MTDKEKELQAEAIGYYRKRIAELEMTVGTLRTFSNEQATCIERLEKENAELKKACDEAQELLDKQIEATLKLDKENAELSEKLNRHKHDCPNCSAFGKHCPHRVNGDPYTYDCYLTVAELEKENAELKETVIKMNNVITETFSNLTKAKEIIEKVAKMYRYSPRVDEIIEQAEQFLSEVDK